VIFAANGELYFGGGSSWSGGGTLDYNMFISDSGNVGIGTTTPGVKVAINDPGTGLAFTNAASGNFNIGLLGGVGSAEAYIYQRANSPLLFGTNNTERLRIDSSGRVGIGTTTPTTLLDVNADTVRVRTARTPASATATGATGEICWDASYIYVCTATNTWKRTAITTW
jgi:hypothetical protein